MILYKTVRQEASETQIIEKSRFIAHVKPVESREEAEDFIGAIKAQYKDATHNVPAMVIGDGSQIQWASDDGEPQGTSGAPMVQMMVKEGLTNLVVVVTRYFGGIKLGTGGLVRAYTSSAKLAIEKAGVCSVRNMCCMSVEIDYTHLAKLQKMAVDHIDEEDTKASDFLIDGIEYGAKVLLQILTLEENEETMRGILANLTSGDADIKAVETVKSKV